MKQLYTYFLAVGLIGLTAYFFNNPQWQIITRIANNRLSRIERDMSLKVKNTFTDQDIIIVNIGNMSRMGIALEIEKIQQGKPKVLGIDVCFVSTIKTQLGITSKCREKLCLFSTIKNLLSTCI